MFKETFDFTTPDDNIIAWRYIDFTKLIDLLVHKKLFFCRSDKFEDPFEGFLKLTDSHPDELETLEKTKKYYFINCWHLNKFQSDAMWRIFLHKKNGVAIKSSIANIKKAIEISQDDIHIAQVFYRDFENLSFFNLAFEEQNVFPNNRGGTVNQFTYKRNSFEHEKEMRLIYIDLPIPHSSKLTMEIERPILDYKKIDINLEYLIQEIVISPFADSWFKDLVVKVISDLGLKFDVNQSNLYKK